MYAGSRITKKELSILRSMNIQIVFYDQMLISEYVNGYC